MELRKIKGDWPYASARKEEENNQTYASAKKENETEKN